MCIILASTCTMPPMSVDRRCRVPCRACSHQVHAWPHVTLQHPRFSDHPVILLLQTNQCLLSKSVRTVSIVPRYAAVLFKWLRL
jgi:hypothetical protein